jgi:hypothetical protein
MFRLVSRPSSHNIYITVMVEALTLEVNVTSAFNINTCPGQSTDQDAFMRTAIHIGRIKVRNLLP